MYRKKLDVQQLGLNPEHFIYQDASHDPNFGHFQDQNKKGLQI